MPYSASLIDYTPSPRYGTSDPWTQARIEQSASRSGPFTEIETQTLDPAYTDPESPPSYDFTTELVTIYPGWLRVVFLDADGTQEPTEPVFVGSAIRPTVADVANLMPDRTTVEGGGTAGTFTADTDPTATQVDALIDLVLDSVEPLVPAGAGGETLRSARAVVALHTAILIETGHFGDQTNVNDTRVGVWERLIAAHTAVLTAAAEGNEPGGTRVYSVPLTTPTATYAADPTALLP